MGVFEKKYRQSTICTLLGGLSLQYTAAREMSGITRHLRGCWENINIFDA